MTDDADGVSGHSTGEVARALATAIGARIPGARQAELYSRPDGTLERLIVHVEPGLFTTSPDGRHGDVIPGVELARALTTLGWSLADGMYGDVTGISDDITTVRFTAICKTGPWQARVLWDAAGRCGRLLAALSGEHRHLVELAG